MHHKNVSQVSNDFLKFLHNTTFLVQLPYTLYTLTTKNTNPLNVFNLFIKKTAKEIVLTPLV